jgi:PAS domain S-box-containing protein
MDREFLGRALADTETRLALATRAAGLGIWDWDLRTNAMTYSDRAKEICGFPLDRPVTYEQVVAVTHPEDLPRTSAMARRALDPEKREQEPYEYRLLLADGSVRWVLAYGQAVFETVDGAVRATRYVGTIQDITARHETEAQLRDSESRLRLALDAAKMAVWEYDVVADKTTFSPELTKLFGFPGEMTPDIHDLRARYLAGEQDKVRAAGRRALERGETYFEVEYQIARFDGEHRWMLVRAEIQLSKEGQPVRVIGVVFDITERKKSAERQALLVDELNHRVKNTLSVVQSMTKLTLKHAQNPEQAGADIESRIMNLSRAHDLLTEQRWEHVSLNQLAKRLLSVADERRIALQGPDLWLRPRLAVDLSMVLHELLTNAIKYGALSVETGRVDLHWSKLNDRLLLLRWSERDGPIVSPPTRSGLGSGLIRNVLKEHGAEVEMKFEPAGLSCAIRFSADAGREPDLQRAAGVSG